MYGFHVFKVFQSPKIHDFLRFFELLHTFLKSFKIQKYMTFYFLSIALMLHCAFTTRVQTSTGPALTLEKPERRRSYENDHFDPGRTVKQTHSWTPDE